MSRHPPSQSKTSRPLQKGVGDTVVDEVELTAEDTVAEPLVLVLIIEDSDAVLLLNVREDAVLLLGEDEPEITEELALVEEKEVTITDEELTVPVRELDRLEEEAEEEVVTAELPEEVIEFDEVAAPVLLAALEAGLEELVEVLEKLLLSVIARLEDVDNELGLLDDAIEPPKVEEVLLELKVPDLMLLVAVSVVEGIALETLLPDETLLTEEETLVPALLDGIAEVLETWALET